MKLSKRLATIASYINDDDKVLDVGCDHGYLDIYLALYKKNDLIIASDISEEVIKSTINNIKKYKVQNKIKTYCTDGTRNISDNYNTIVIAGMGYHTIINILKESKLAEKLIICSNNDWPNVRKEVSKIGYYLDEERLVVDGKKLYSIILFRKGKRKITRKEIVVGKYFKDNKDLYNEYYTKIKNIYIKIPNLKIIKKIYYLKMLRYLKSYLRKENR